MNDLDYGYFIGAYNDGVNAQTGSKSHRKALYSGEALRQWQRGFDGEPCDLVEPDDDDWVDPRLALWKP